MNESFAVQKTGFKAKTEELAGEIDDFKKRYSVLENQVKLEMQERLELEKMLENEIKNKQQLELGIRMLERDAYEKQGQKLFLLFYLTNFRHTGATAKAT